MITIEVRTDIIIVIIYYNSYHNYRGKQTFPIKGHIVNVLGFESHTLSAATTQL